MNRGTLLLSAVGLSLVAAAVAGASLAAGNRTVGVTTIKAVTSPPKMVANRYIQDQLRWNKDVYTVASGGTLHVVNVAADEGPHTFTVVQKKDEPKTGLQAVTCKVCIALG